jgi:hypothetical protein
MHITERSRGELHELHLCQDCAKKSDYIKASVVPPNSELYRAMQKYRATQKIRPLVYLTLPRQDGVEFVLPRVSPTKTKLLLAVFYFVLQSGLFLAFFLMIRFRVQGRLLEEVLIVAAFALLPLVKGSAEQLVTPGMRIRIEPDRLIVPASLPKKPPVEVPLVTIARFELDLPPQWQVRIGYRTPRLLAEHFNGTRTLIARNYPPELLQHLAEDLRRFTKSQQQFFAEGHNVPAAEHANISIADVSEIPPIERDVISQPHTSKIRSVQEGELHTFYMRGGGIFRNRIFLLMYGAITVIPLSILLPIVIRGLSAPAKWHPGALPLVAFGVVVVVAAFAGLVAGIHGWSKKYVLVVRANGKQPGSLTCIGRGIFGTREIAMEHAQLRGASTRGRRFLKAMHVHETEPQAILFLTDARGRKRALLSGEELEMRWLATRIRALLDLPRR